MQAKIIVGSGVATRDEGTLNSFLGEGWQVAGVFANGPKPWFVLVQQSIRPTLVSMKDFVDGTPGPQKPDWEADPISTPPASKKKGRPKKVK